MKVVVLFMAFLLPAMIFPQETSPGVQRHATEYHIAETVKLPDVKDDRKALEKRGDTYGRLKQWRNAAECYKKLVTRYPRVANYHYKYGGVLGMIALENKMKALGLVGDIKKAFKTAAALDPEHKAVRWALVELYMQLPGILGGSRKKALRYAEELEQLSKAEGCLAKGYIYDYGNKHKKAEPWYAMALEHLHTLKEPSKNELRYTIGKLCADHNTKLDKGIYYLQRYLHYYTSQDTVESHIVYCDMARLYRLKGEKKRAMIWIGKALEADAKFKAAHHEKALIEAL